MANIREEYISSAIISHPNKARASDLYREPRIIQKRGKYKYIITHTENCFFMIANINS